jgi:hypothetical protein
VPRGHRPRRWSAADAGSERPPRPVSEQTEPSSTAPGSSADSPRPETSSFIRFLLHGKRPRRRFPPPDRSNPCRAASGPSVQLAFDRRSDPPTLRPILDPWSTVGLDSAGGARHPRPGAFHRLEAARRRRRLGGVAEAFGSRLGRRRWSIPERVGNVAVGRVGVGLTSRVGHLSQVLVGRDVGRDRLRTGSGRADPRGPRGRGALPGGASGRGITTLGTSSTFGRGLSSGRRDATSWARSR